MPAKGPLPDDLIYVEEDDGDEHFVSVDGGDASSSHSQQHRHPLYEDPEAWRIHVLKLPTGEGRCVPCNQVFKRFQAAKRHFHVMHQTPEEYECCYCGQRYNKYAFATHINSKHGVVGVKNVVEMYGRKVE